MSNAFFHLSDICKKLRDIFNLDYKNDTIVPPICSIVKRSLPEFCFLLFGDIERRDFKECPEFAKKWAKPKNRLDSIELDHFIRHMDNESLSIMDSLYPEETDGDGYFNRSEIEAYCYKAMCDLFENNPPYPGFAYNDLEIQDEEDLSEDYITIQNTKRRLCLLIIHYSYITQRTIPSLGNTKDIVPTDFLQDVMEGILDKYDHVLLYNLPYTGKSTFCKQYVINHDWSYYYEKCPDQNTFKTELEKKFPDLELWSNLSKMKGHFFSDINPYNGLEVLDYYNKFTVFIDNIENIDTCSSLYIPKGCRVVYIYDNFPNLTLPSDIFPLKFTNSSYRENVICKYIFYNAQIGIIKNKKEVNTVEKLAKEVDISTIKLLYSLQDPLKDFLIIYKLYAKIYRSVYQTELEKDEQKDCLIAKQKAFKVLSSIIYSDGNSQNPSVSFQYGGTQRRTTLPVTTHIRNILSFLSSREQEFLFFLYKASRKAELSLSELKEYLLSNPEFKSLVLDNLFRKLSDLGWIDGDQFAILPQIVDSLSIDQINSIKGEKLDCYISIMKSLTHAMRGLSNTYIDKKMIYSLIWCLHDEYKDRIIGKSVSEKKENQKSEILFNSRERDSIISYFYQESLQFCLFYSPPDMRMNVPLYYELFSFIIYNPEVLVVRDAKQSFVKKIKENKRIKIIKLFHLIVFHLTDNHDVILHQLINETTSIVETNNAMITDSSPAFRSIDIEDNCLSLILFLNYYIRECNFIFLRAIEHISSKKVLSIIDDSREIETIIEVLDQLTDSICANGSDKKPFHVYIEAKRIIEHTKELIIRAASSVSCNKSSYYNNKASDNYSDIDDFQPYTTPLIISQQLLIAKKLYVYCLAKEGKTLPETVADDIIKLSKKCGDLPLINECLIKQIDDSIWQLEEKSL